MDVQTVWRPSGIKGMCTKALMVQVRGLVSTVTCLGSSRKKWIKGPILHTFEAEKFAYAALGPWGRPRNGVEDYNGHTS